MKKKRPIFLSILCILGFIGTGYRILNRTWRLVYNKGDYTFGENDIDKASLEEIAKEADKALWQIARAPNYKLVTSIELVCALIAFVGVVFMWKLKKKGYYMYAPGQVVTIITPLVLFPKWEIFNVLGALGILLMIIMYAFTLKKMK